jgi:drug/metabolite transporter (DMT)-like permease
LFPTMVMWGATFPAGKLALDHLPPLAFMAWTRGLGALSVLALVPLLRRRGRSQSGTFRKVLGPGLLLGALIFVAYVLQTEGLKRTTATNAGFITGLYVVFTPILAGLAFKHRVPRAAWLAVMASVIGLALLSVKELDQIRLHAGDLLVLAGAVVWAGHVVGVGHYSPKFPSWMLSLSQMTATAIFQLLAVILVGLRPHAALRGDVWPLLIITGVVGSGIAYTLQIVGQQEVTATRAVVLLAGEALFAALFAAIWIGERLSIHQWAGAILVLAAMAYSELAARRPSETRLEPAAAP